VEQLLTLKTYTVLEEVVLFDAVKTGYKFIGWVDINENPITKIAKGTTGAVILKAKFEIKEYTISYYLDNEIFIQQQHKFGDNIEMLADIEKVGYEFSGWQIDDFIILYAS